MKVKIIINTMSLENDDISKRHAEVWNGEMDILPKGEYLTKISIIADGYEHPICDVPFSPITGYWQWIPPLVDDEDIEEREQIVIVNTEPL